MKDDLEYALNGHGRVEMIADGALRARRAQQPPLFQEADASAIGVEEISAIRRRLTKWNSDSQIPRHFVKLRKLFRKSDGSINPVLSTISLHFR